MRVAEIWRYPVKSMGGEQLTSAPVDERGVEFDRAWGVHDPATGMVLTARREPTLLMMSATVVEDRPVITAEDGTDLSTDAALSAALGRPVEIRSADDGPGTFENPMNIDDETDWITWQSAGHSFHDSRSTISLVCGDTMRDWDPRRFRINVILDGSGEDDLTDNVTIGSVVVRLRKRIERCIMVSRPQPGIERDLGVLKTIIRERDNQLGIGGVVAQSGVIAVGDELH